MTPGQAAGTARDSRGTAPGGTRGAPWDLAQARSHFDSLAPEADRWLARSRAYHEELKRLLRFLVPPGLSVLEVGCGTGDLLAALAPARGVGVDLSRGMVQRARARFPALRCVVGDAHRLPVSGAFDAIVLSDLVGQLGDVWAALAEARRLSAPHTRVVVTYYNFLWEPVLKLAERLGLKMPQRAQNWLSSRDLENLLHLAGFEVVTRGERVLLPKRIPGLSWLCNRLLAKLPGLRRLGLMHYLVARPAPDARARREGTVTVVIPCKDEAGTIADAVARTPDMGLGTEIVFVDGNSKDGTVERIREEIERWKGRREIRLVPQGDGHGKGDAVRKGFAAARGDVLMILDADLTVPPDDLPRFYETLVSGRGELVMGSRLIYPMEKQAMRLANLLGNKAFSMMFTWLLDQRIKDTLCGTKVLWRRDYEEIARNRPYFGDFDPFGDYDLIFGAAKRNLKIVEIPVRYRERVYGDTKISRWRHGWLLLKMCGVAFRKMKLA
ncbi:MAG: glycosyltransferase [Planctomycetales bacterium]|nr:glycosyltransferase [Planctomycetales bacterium]